MNILMHAYCVHEHVLHRICVSMCCLCFSIFKTTVIGIRVPVTHLFILAYVTHNNVRLHWVAVGVTAITVHVKTRRPHCLADCWQLCCFKGKRNSYVKKKTTSELNTDFRVKWCLMMLLFCSGAFPSIQMSLYWNGSKATINWSIM